MMKTHRPVQILGSTGSIGVQALDVADQLGYQVTSLAASKNVKVIEEQARRYHPHACAMTDATAAKDLKIALSDTDIQVYSGMDGLCAMIQESAPNSEEEETVLNAVSGEAGLLPTLTTLQANKRLALANKESLVVAGELVMSEAKKHHATILPVDSEHCAIWQCLRAGKENEVDKLIVTASGGPFFGKTRADLQNVTAKDALAHPTWNMGAQITIDSATLMNKGFEVIEAAYLFGIPEERIEVLVHRESIVHSMVQFCDHSVIAQMSVPDMRFCIAHAIEYPHRNPAVLPELDLAKVATLHFAKPDTNTFSLLEEARVALRIGGATAAVVNAANEVAVEAFLQDRLSFNALFDIICEVRMSLPQAKDIHDLDGIIAMDRLARAETAKRI